MYLFIFLWCIFCKNGKGESASLKRKTCFHSEQTPSHTSPSSATFLTNQGLKNEKILTSDPHQMDLNQTNWTRQKHDLLNNFIRSNFTC